VPLSPETIAVGLAFAAAILFGTGVVITQFGLKYLPPLSGAAVSVPAFTSVFLLLSPILLRGEPVVWRAVPIFIGVGLVFPALLTTLTFSSNRLLGPVVTGALGNLAPLFSVTLAVMVLHEPLHPLQLAGLVTAISGVFLITISRTSGKGDWRSWALLLPIAAAFLRGVVPPIIKVGLAIWPSPIGAGLVGYIVSSLVVLTSERLRTGRFIARAPISGHLWFAAVGIVNGVATLLLYAAVGYGRVSLVTPLVATYPLVTVVLSAVLLSNVRVTAKLACGTVAAVAGVILVLVG
jgi:drug/metabolite transporter (DMT)-like permease